MKKNFNTNTFFFSNIPDIAASIFTNLMTIIKHNIFFKKQLTMINILRNFEYKCIVM